MRHARTATASLALGLAALLGPVPGAQAADHQAPGLPDPAAGATAAQVQAFDVESVAASTVGGTLVVNLTVTIKSAIPLTTPILCSVNAYLAEASVTGTNTIAEAATVAATRAGAKATCRVSLPYSWTVLSSATARVSLNALVSATKTGAPQTGLLNRSSSFTLGSIAVPANGATTTISANATL
jgi:hypothetical protein